LGRTGKFGRTIKAGRAIGVFEKEQHVGYSKKKLIERNEISGHHHAVDVPPGEYSRNELIKRPEDRLDALKAAIDADSSKDGKITLDSPALGDAISRLPGRSKKEE
jgi:hypothetical protein